MHIRLEAGSDLVQRLAHEADPVRAVEELIWNSLDADAENVRVDLTRNDAGGVTGVVITDDGHGMSPETVVSAFKWVGNSWKRSSTKTQGKGRRLHGKNGQGRLRAFALGTQVVWRTVADSTDGVRSCTTVRATVQDRSDFGEPTVTQTDDAPGTVFEAVGRDDLSRLDSDSTANRLTAGLAPYLVANSDAKVFYDGALIDPLRVIERDFTTDIAWTHEAVERSASLRVIEWSEARLRSFHLCDDAGLPIEEVDAPAAPDFSYSAYVLWDEMAAHAGEWLLASLETSPSVVGSLRLAALEHLDQYFDGRRAEKRRQVVDKWKAEASYPYQGEPATEEEKVERATFDVVATTVRRHIPKSRRQERLMLGLLKEALQSSPEELSTLLDHFVGLSADEKEQLQRLLVRTPLAHLIRATTDVTKRFDFLAALRHIVFDPEASQLVKERDNLHRILERELWLFGEQYNLMLSERSLTAALRQHLHLLGVENRDVNPVTQTDGRTGRLDLMLSARAKDHDRIRHLVVELKAPSVPGTEVEAGQIKRYARSIAADPQFASVRAHWDFLLVVTEYNEEVRKDISQRGRRFGILDESPVELDNPVSYRVWVKSWAEVLGEAEERLTYYQEGLRLDPSMEDIRAYLDEFHGDVIPEGLFESPSIE